MMSKQRLAELSAELTAADLPPNTEVRLILAEALSLAALAVAGNAALDKLVDGLSVLSPKPGDLLIARTPPYEGDELASCRAALETLAHHFRLRVVAFPNDSTLELVDGDILADVANAVRGWPPADRRSQLSNGLVRELGERGLTVGRVTRQ